MVLQFCCPISHLSITSSGEDSNERKTLVKHPKYFLKITENTLERGKTKFYNIFFKNNYFIKTTSSFGCCNWSEVKPALLFSRMGNFWCKRKMLSTTIIYFMLPLGFRKKIGPTPNFTFSRTIKVIYFCLSQYRRKIRWKFFLTKSLEKERFVTLLLYNKLERYFPITNLYGLFLVS